MASLESQAEAWGPEAPGQIGPLGPGVDQQAAWPWLWPLPLLCTLLQLSSGGDEIKPQIYASYAMFFMAVSTALRKMCKIPNVSVDYAVAQCGNLK